MVHMKFIFNEKKDDDHAKWPLGQKPFDAWIAFDTCGDKSFCRRFCL